MPITITPEFEAVLKTIAEGKNIFITGKAGTGKSTLLKQFIQDARNKNILVTAPTGVAALNINGSLFSCWENMVRLVVGRTLFFVSR